MEMGIGLGVVGGMVELFVCSVIDLGYGVVGVMDDGLVGSSFK